MKTMLCSYFKAILKGRSESITYKANRQTDFFLHVEFSFLTQNCSSFFGPNLRGITIFDLSKLRVDALFLFHPTADSRRITSREVYYREFQPSHSIFRRSGAIGLFRPQVPFNPQPRYTAQLLTLPQHRANNQ